jgi:signal transduction histidine kinase
MSIFRWHNIKQFLALLATEPPDADIQSNRIQGMERNIILPVKAVVIAVLFYYLLLSGWFTESSNSQTLITLDIAMEVLQRFFLFYILLNVSTSIMLLGMSQLPFKLIQVVVFTNGLVDSVFISGLTLVTGGFDSTLYWIFLGLIVRNAVSISVSWLQIVLNLFVILGYIIGGALDIAIMQFDPPPGAEPETITEPFAMRIILLIVMTFCCYAVQVLLDRQRRANEEAREYALRREQLRVTGQLAAEIAHQLKNPLGIINNAAFNLQRNVKEGKATITQQIRIIREEVERSDRIITDMMGYARMAEGTLEKLDPIEELDRAIDLVFPVAAHFDVVVHRDYASVVPPLVMQRNHLREILVNLLQNSREALNCSGHVYISAKCSENYSVLITIEDNGPGVPPELRDKIFEPYYTTKEKGTGLGLAIVKHNVEIYGGTITVGANSGNGARFVVDLPAKSLMKVRK